MNMLVPLKYEYTPMQPHESSSATMACVNADAAPPPPYSGRDGQRQQTDVERRLQHIERLQALLVVAPKRWAGSRRWRNRGPTLELDIVIVEFACADQLHCRPEPSENPDLIQSDGRPTVKRIEVSVDHPLG